MDVDDVDQGLGSDPPDFAQTREDNVPVDDSDENSTPESYADIRPVDTIDLTRDDGEAEGRNLVGGTTLAMSKDSKGPIYLNSYGYKSCAITVWEKEEAERIVDKRTNIRGDPHKKAMETNEEGEYIHRGKIKKILNVAWKPKGQIQSMKDLLASVEELNPKKKADNRKYRYPFSTVLVEWTDGLERTWISRTNYKTLSSQSKASNERTDRKFYQIGLLQVRRYQEYQGGDSRNLGDLERTPPGLAESPEPGESNAIRGDTASHQANNRGEPKDIGQVGQAQGNQNEGGRTTPGDPRRPGPVNQSSQSVGSQNAGSQNAGSQGQASQQQENHGNEPRTMSSFYAEWLRKNNLNANTEVSTLGDQLFGRFRAAAHAYADEYKRNVGQQLQDDMGIL
ncbi:hypothetical protein ASPSYDRAFT_74106 [Aspergillus sydowii CBS 593.65]|uniref:Uncharacterized protein n=1 Tax=Aspergillus sydowii CBS 593.65 TaxID=1036612 RepID=A0A1L9SY12_9EURO|nr:uncharacterized protein ASPSYDRAFT_74106 [Aspergillus sydowii CBS 593.65]OJJ51923.1 hypothetical protein ASPSYDRAFT_74106 [Aspergillus sydowii CBS 593.65]